jgi:tetratricopeptide (TPR) repeat protein
MNVVRASVLAAIAFWFAGSALTAEPELPVACSGAALAADIGSCDQAIASESDPVAKSMMLHRRAYALVEKYQYEDALKDLDAALLLRPDFADALHERAYVRGELSDLDRALEDLNREIAIRPAWPSAWQERAFVRHWSGDFAGAWADRDRQFALQPTPGTLLARADEAIWLGRFDDATRDVAAAEALARNASNAEVAQQIERKRRRIAVLSTPTPGGSPAARCDAAEKDSKFDGTNLIGDCTAAFLAAADNRIKANFLTTRSIAWLIQRQDPESSTADQRIAAALDPGNADLHSNLGFSFINIHHSWAAEREFDRALQIDEKKWPALAGRASARYNQGRKDEAFADAKRSFELHSNDVALLVLGDIARDRNDRKSAKLYWMAAYHLGTRDEDLIGRLRSIGVDHPEREPQAQ